MTTSGQAYCWGYNVGNLGTGFAQHSATPSPVAGGHHFRSVAVGFNHSCGLTESGAAYCWGTNQEGQLGTPVVATTTLIPVPVAGSIVFASADTRCGVTAAGAGYCWGPNRFGQLGTGAFTGPELCSFSCSRRPVPVTGGHSFRAISSGRAAGVHSCAVTSSGTAHCWGLNFALVPDH